MSLVFKKIIIYFMFFLFLLPFFCFADNITLTPNVLWYSVNQAQWIGGGAKNIVVNAQCPIKTNSATVEIKKGANIMSKPVMDYSEGIYSSEYRPPSICPFGGNYEVKVRCDDVWINETKTFTIHKLKLDIDGLSSFQTYEKTFMLDKTSDFDIYATVFDNENNIDINYIDNNDELSFSAKIYTNDNEVIYDGLINVDKREPNTRTNYGDWILHLGKMPDASIKNKDYNIKITANYKDKITSAIETSFFHFRGFEEEESEENTNEENEEYFYASVSDLSDPAYIPKETDAATVHISVNQTLSNFNLKKEHISADFYDDGDKIATLKINNIIKESSREYSFTFENLPSLDIQKDNYYIKMYIDYPGQNEIVLNIPVEIAVEFGGISKKKDGVIVPATIEIRKDGFYKKIKSNERGSLSAVIPFGIYDIIFTFGDYNNDLVIIKTHNVNFEKTESSINFAKNSIIYDNIKAGEVEIDLNGMRVANMIVFQFSLPYDDIEVQTYYDASKIYNEENIAIFKCTNWNNGAQNCISGFKEVSDIIKNTNSDFVILKTTNLGSFIISSKDSIQVNLNKINKEFFSEEEIVFQGMVTDMEDIPIYQAIVHYSIKGTDIKGSIETQEDGSFEKIFRAPKNSGTYRLDYYSTKNPFFPSKNESQTFKLLKKADMSVSLPSEDVRNIHLNEKTNLNFTIKNNGDIPINDIIIEIKCDGLNEKDQYNYFPKNIDLLDKGHEEKINFFINLNEDYCEFYGCKTIYSCGISVKSKEKIITESIVLPLNLPKTNNKTADQLISKSKETINKSTAADKNSFIPSFSITGFASKINPIKNNSGFSNIKLIALFLLIIAAILVFKNKNLNEYNNKPYNYAKDRTKSNLTMRKNIINSFNKIKEEIKRR